MTETQEGARATGSELERASIADELALGKNAPRALSEDELRDVRDFTDALAALESGGVAVEDYAELYGTGFEVVDDKSILVGVPFVVLNWRFNSGDMGSFVSAEIVTEDGRKLVINDGSTGVREQLAKVTRVRMAHGHARPQSGLLVRKGLRRSDYTIEIADKHGVLKPSRATTFYLSQ